jgi:predicted  nucleic acid-binding Zn-ribbon protein
MTGDQRLFAYALDPQLQRLGWRLDEQLAALARALAALEPLRAKCGALAAEAAQVAHDLARAQAQRMDPARARQALDYLAGLHVRHASTQQEMQAAERDATERREALAATQREVDKLQRDRRECLDEHLREVQRREQRATDQDWTARAAWRARGTIEGEALS